MGRRRVRRGRAVAARCTASCGRGAAASSSRARREALVGRAAAVAALAGRRARVAASAGRRSRPRSTRAARCTWGRNPATGLSPPRTRNCSAWRARQGARPQPACTAAKGLALPRRAHARGRRRRARQRRAARERGRGRLVRRRLVRRGRAAVLARRASDQPARALLARGSFPSLAVDVAAAGRRAPAACCRTRRFAAWPAEGFDFVAQFWRRRPAQPSTSPAGGAARRRYAAFRHLATPRGALHADLGRCLRPRAHAAPSSGGASRSAVKPRAPRRAPTCCGGVVLPVFDSAEGVKLDVAGDNAALALDPRRRRAPRRRPARASTTVTLRRPAVATPRSTSAVANVQRRARRTTRRCGARSPLPPERRGHLRACSTSARASGARSAPRPSDGPEQGRRRAAATLLAVRATRAEQRRARTRRRRDDAWLWRSRSSTTKSSRRATGGGAAGGAMSGGRRGLRRHYRSAIARRRRGRTTTGPRTRRAPSSAQPTWTPAAPRRMTLSRKVRGRAVPPPGLVPARSRRRRASSSSGGYARCGDVRARARRLWVRTTKPLSPGPPCHAAEGRHRPSWVPPAVFVVGV